MYVGQPNPNYQMNFTTDLTFLNGRLSLHTTFAYEDGLTPGEQPGSTAPLALLTCFPPHTSLATQAAIMTAYCYTGINGDNTVGRLFSFPFTCNPAVNGSQIGVIQTVNTFRFNDLSINYELPKTLSLDCFVSPG